MKTNISKQTLKLYFGKGLSLYNIKSKITDELSRINYLLRNKQLFQSQEDFRDYKKYALERKTTLRGVLILINKELGYKDKGQRDEILNTHLKRLKKIRGSDKSPKRNSK